MNNCNLKPEVFLSLASGLSQNVSLTKLMVAENSWITKDNLQKICEAMLENKNCKLIELDLSKCNINSEKVRPLIILLENNYKLRNLNLKDNFIKDDAASDLL